jgi:RHS repeat-associated protein
MVMPDRTIASAGYRYGFNGKENDHDMSSDGMPQDYGERIYDPRVAKFLSVDPISANYPMLTPYQFASNRPIDGVDLDGKEWSKTESLDDKGNTVIKYDIKIKVVDKDFCADQAKLNQIAITAAGELQSSFNKASNDGIKYEFNIEFTKVDKFQKGDFGVEIDNEKATQKGVLGEKQPGATTQKGGILLKTHTLYPYKMTLPGGKKKLMTKEIPMSLEDIGHTVAHELLHTSRLDHPWKETLIKDIAQLDKNGKRSAVPDKTIIDNVMNSPQNPNPLLQPNGSKSQEVTPGQVDYVRKVVELETRLNNRSIPNK